MAGSGNRSNSFGRRVAFPTTCWTALGDDARSKALQEELYKQYWEPLYCCARRRGFAREDAKDFTQGFLTEILLGREFLAKADQRRGKFRSLLIRAFRNYIENIRRKKRIPTGSEADISEYPVSDAVPHDPAAAFDYAWATGVLDEVLATLESECLRDGLHSHWRIFEERVVRPILDGTPAPGLPEICRKFAIDSEAQVSNMIVTVKRRFRRLLVRHLTGQSDSESEAEEALRDFLSIFSGS